MKPGQLVSSREAKQATKQHTQPCGDCPWRRDSLAGWLGSMTADEWLQAAHGETRIECHTLLGAQCAGSAIYRRNVCKQTRTETLRLDADRVKVFDDHRAFKKHHEEG
jgi:hypothetical protein